MPIPFLNRTCLAAAALALGATAPLAAQDLGSLTITASPTPAVEGGAEAWFEIRRTPGADWSIDNILYPIVVEGTGSAIVDSAEANLAGADVYLNDPARFNLDGSVPQQFGEGGGLGILDYDSSSNTLLSYVWIDGFSEFTRIRVRAYEDGVTEAPETLTLTIADTDGWQDAGMQILQSSATVTIVDRIPPPTVAIAASSGAEGGADGTLTFTRTGSTTLNLQVNFALTGTATPKTDYQVFGVAPNGTSVIIPAGASQAVVRIRPIDDKLVEGTESVIATLQAGSYQRAATATATVSIRDNDTLPPIALVASQVGPGKLGTITWLSPGWEMTGSGLGIAGLAENATEARYPYIGNNVFTTRITAVGSVSAAAQAGILLRDSLGNKLDAIFVTGSRRIGIAQQTVKGGGIATTLGSTATTLPVWLRAVRQNATITYQQSGDGKTWTTIATRATTMPSAYQAGLFVASGSTNLITAGIETFTATPSAAR
jgi:hypothetical protein